MIIHDLVSLVRKKRGFFPLFSFKLFRMKKTLFFLLFILVNTMMNAQTEEGKTEIPRRTYFETASEFIFSSGAVEADPLNVDDNVRFSAFLHIQEQMHFDLNDHFGFYTGVSIRNVGIITDLNDSVKIKQRVYTAGIPLALKIGLMKKTFLAIGGEAEFALNYKQKVFVNGVKNKMNEWFSDRSEIFLPSLFAEVHAPKGFYIKFKYYLTDFLVSDKQKIDVQGIAYVPTKSPMAYLSFGMAIPDRKLSK